MNTLSWYLSYCEWGWNDHVNTDTSLGISGPYALSLVNTWKTLHVILHSNCIILCSSLKACKAFYTSSLILANLCLSGFFYFVFNNNHPMSVSGIISQFWLHLWTVMLNSFSYTFCHLHISSLKNCLSKAIAQFYFSSGLPPLLNCVSSFHH